MNKFYHYGDSFATCDDSETIFSKYIANNMGLEWVDRGYSGRTNEYILSCLLVDLEKFKKGDVVFIGFTFFTRGGFINNQDDLTSTNVYYNDLTGNVMDGYHDLELKRINEIDLKRRTNILEYVVDYTWDYYVRLFKYLINPTIQYLKSKGINVRYFFLKKDFIKLGDIQKEFYNFLGDGEIDFYGNDYIDFLNKKEWMKEQSVHYTWNIQSDLADTFIELWDK